MPKKNKHHRGGGPASVGASRRPKLCGPSIIRTLRGRLLGREVALICCGESHEDAIDLTRKGCVVDPQWGWISVPTDSGVWPSGFDIENAISCQGGLTIEGAKSWAEKILEKLEDDSDSDDDSSTRGGILVYEPGVGAKARGTARLFDPGEEYSEAHPFADGTKVWRYEDLDQQALAYNRRRLLGEEVPVEEHDALILERKKERLGEGLELFDDWLLRAFAASSSNSSTSTTADSNSRTSLELGQDNTLKEEGRKLVVRLILEAAVQADEVELHVEQGVSLASVASECLRCIELDSDEDSDDAHDPDDGTGSFIDYLRRRVEANVQLHCVRHVDPRELGDDDSQEKKWLGLLTGPPPKDLEMVELDELKASEAVPKDDSSKPSRKPKSSAWYGTEAEGPALPLPSWEAYFGAASELLYYSPYIKADYTPFLARCVCSADAMRRFFDALYFGTVSQAIAELSEPMSDERRGFTRLRSHAIRAVSSKWFGFGGKLALLRRPGDSGLVPVKAAPFDRYLKSKGSDPPRTWVSGLAKRIEDAGADVLVAKARKWFAASVDHLLSDPKYTDTEGDYFTAWLRECHRDIYDDIDNSDPAELIKLKFVESESNPGKKNRHNLGEIRIPGFDAGFQEVAAFDPSRVSTKRERVMAKILVDGFQVRLVDLAAILTVADLALSVPAGACVVVIFYGGVDHTNHIVDFWMKNGFSAKGLSDNGVVGKEDWEDDEPRGLNLPDYLHDFSSLFPVP